MKIRLLLTEIESGLEGDKLDMIISEVSELYGEIATLESDMSLMMQKLDSLQQMLVDELSLFHTDVVERLDYIIAFLFMLVCFELMRLVRGWTKWWKNKGGD